MALIKEPYGLVYNTDGSLCTTVRPDQIPFPGVNSFAVETATENLFGIDAWEFDADQSTFFPSGLASGKTWEDCWDANQRAYVGGQNITVYNLRSQILDLGQVYSAGTKITLSWKHKGYLLFIKFSYGLTTDSLTDFNSTNTYEIKGDASLAGWESGYGLHLKINGVRTRYDGSPQSLLDRWYDVEITYTLPTDARYVKVVWDFWRAYLADGERGVKGYIHKPQLEVKPFASSFVVGSRPNGRLELENTSGEDMNNLVLTGWFKFFDTEAEPTFQKRIIEKATSGNGGNGFVLYNTKNICFAVDETKRYTSCYPEMNKWYYIILIFDNGVNTARIYDGDTIHEVVITKTVPENENNISLGCPVWRTQGIMNGLVSNFFIGKYRKPNGEIIWTDEYIREVYEAQIPFPVSNKLSIY